MADEPTMARVLVHLAADGIDDDTGTLFVACWARQHHRRLRSSRATATALRAAADDLCGPADDGTRTIVHRWIDCAAPRRR